MANSTGETKLALENFTHEIRDHMSAELMEAFQLVSVSAHCGAVVVGANSKQRRTRECVL